MDALQKHVTSIQNGLVDFNIVQAM
jgi:hypothetical protein